MDLVGLEQRDAIATLTLNRPTARNALSTELCDAIVAALAAIERQGGARVVILAGAGDTFCSGADLTEVSGPQALEFLPVFERMLDAVESHPVPTIAAIEGVALGGGLQLACACDFRIAASDARLGVPSARLGIVVDLDNVQRLVALAGLALAKEILLVCRSLTGGEAAETGLVTSSVEAGGAVAAARSLAEKIVALSPLSVRGAKRALGVVVDGGRVRVRDPERARSLDEIVAAAYASEDLVEGLSALAERRAPRWRGR